MLDELINQCKNPVNFWLHVVAFVFGVWGLWMHNSVAILLAIILISFGHIYANHKMKQGQEIKVGPVEAKDISEINLTLRKEHWGGEHRGIAALVSKPKSIKEVFSLSENEKKEIKKETN